MKIKTLLLAGLVGSLLSGAANAKTEKTEDWYILSLDGQPAGWSMMRETTTEDRVVSETVVKMSVSRGGRAITITMSSTFTETLNGEPISASSVQEMGMMSIRRDIKFTDDGLEVTTNQAGQVMKQDYPPIEGEWLTPAQATKYVRERVAAGDEQFSFRVLDPSAGLEPTEVKERIVERTTVESFGKTVPAIKTLSTSSAAPGMEMVSYISEEGRPIKSTMDAGIFQFDMVRTDEKLAKAQRRAPELLNDTLITPSKPIDNPRKTTEATYVLRMKRGDLPDLAEMPSQTFERIDAKSGRVTVRAKTDQTNAEAPAVKRSSMIDGQDEKIVALKDEAVRGNGGGPAARAEAMRRFAHQYIDEKNLGVGLATAGEVARTQQGDCTEHAVLLAALLRADGIPSRTVSGLIYVDQALGQRKIFGYHMWTQAWLGGRWVDLDATLGADTPFDATHITLGASDMDDANWTNDIVELAPMMGALEIEVQRVK